MHQMQDQKSYLDQILHGKLFSEVEHYPPTALNAESELLCEERKFNEEGSRSGVAEPRASFFQLQERASAKNVKRKMAHIIKKSIYCLRERLKLFQNRSSIDKQ